MTERGKNTNRTSVCMIGALPPPVCGLSLVNSLVREWLKARKMNPKIINLPFTLNRTIRSRLMRTGKILIAILLFLRVMLFDNSKQVYLSFSGGLGQLYDILFLLIARVFSQHIFIHHHSYAYLNRPSLITQLALFFAGQEATHITLGEDMAAQLKSIYPIAHRTMVISNAVFLDSATNASHRPRDCLKTIGFLSNISHAKGIFEFLDVVAELEEREVSIRAIIAGPFEDQQIEKDVRSRLDQLRTVQYVGSKYGDEKTAFYDEIDVLLFPTQYVNEAEPWVIHEAMRQCVPVIAWPRGCIANIITPESGLVVEQDEDFVKAAVNQLLVWRSSSSDFQAVSTNAREQFVSLNKISQRKLEELCDRLILG